MGEVTSAVAEVAGRGRSAVLLKDGRKKSDALKEAKGLLSQASKDQKAHNKSVSSLEKQIAVALAKVDAGKAAAEELKSLKTAHKDASKAHSTATNDIGKHTAAYDKIAAFQPK